MNFKDIVLLKNKDIQGTNLEFIRSKTKRTTQSNPKPVRVALNQRALEIITKWKAVRKKATQDDYLFDIVTDEQSLEQQQRRIEQFIRNTNEGLKRIAKQLGMDEDITTYTARHSYATSLLKDGAPKAFIQESLGHTSMATTEAYLAGFDNAEREKWADSLI